MRQTLPLIGKRLAASGNSGTTTFLAMFNPTSAKEQDRMIDDRTWAVGRVRYKRITEKVKTALTEAEYTADPSLPVFLSS